MKIYGVAVLAVCFLLGQLTGELLGNLIGIDGNIGGVGFAMLLLILVSTLLTKKGWLNDTSEKGIAFWSAMYLPVVIAMSASQNVKAALSGGWAAVIIGIIGTGISFLVIPLIAKIGNNKHANNKEV